MHQINETSAHTLCTPVQSAVRLTPELGNLAGGGAFK